MASKPTYIDLFAGCGGLSLGLHNAGWQGLFAVEKSPDAFSTLKHNLIDGKKHFKWPTKWLGEPTNHDINELIEKHSVELQKLQGKVDMVAGGPPCQGFSMAGRRNENDQRNGLIDSYINFIELVQPKIIFFENVKGFTQKFKKNIDKGKEYALYVESKLGIKYHVKGQLVNFGEYGIPQKRTRFILVGIRKDISGTILETAESFFSKIEENKMRFLTDRKLTVNTNLQDAISDLLKVSGTVESPDTKSFKAGIYSPIKSAYQVLMRNGSNNVMPDSHRFVNHRPDIINKFTDILENCTRNKNIDDDFRKKYSINKHTIIPLNGVDKSPTITSLPDDYIHYCEPRVLTVREYARIQSFPDWYQFKGKYTSGGILRKKEVPRYTQIGNAIPPLFGEQSGLILKRLL